MVFDKHSNDVPKVWVISSHNTTYDIKKWLSTLFQVGIKECPDWHVQAFITDVAVAEIEASRCVFFVERI